MKYKKGRLEQKSSYSHCKWLKWRKYKTYGDDI